MFAVKDVVAFVDGRLHGGRILGFGARVAAEHGARLTGTFVWPPLTPEGPAAYARGVAIRELLASYSAEVSALERSLREGFEREASRLGLRAEWRSVRAPTFSEDVVAHARYADVAISGRPDLSDPRSVPFDLPQALVLASGRPVILVPDEPPPTTGRRILVGWNASREATRAVADGLPFLAHAEAVELLLVDPERHPHGHGEEPGADVALHLARHGVRVDVRRMSSEGVSVGRLVLSRAREFGADLMVMGAYGHSRLTELVFGGVTRTLLRESTLPLLTSR
jgi:nucleotide-binding universal stress UspA family protein